MLPVANSSDGRMVARNIAGIAIYGPCKVISDGISNKVVTTVGASDTVPIGINDSILGLPNSTMGLTTTIGYQALQRQHGENNLYQQTSGEKQFSSTTHHTMISNGVKQFNSSGGVFVNSITNALPITLESSVSSVNQFRALTDQSLQQNMLTGLVEEPMQIDSGPHSNVASSDSGWSTELNSETQLILLNDQLYQMATIDNQAVLQPVFVDEAGTVHLMNNSFSNEPTAFVAKQSSIPESVPTNVDGVLFASSHGKPVIDRDVGKQANTKSTTQGTIVNPSSVSTTTATCANIPLQKMQQQRVSQQHYVQQNFSQNQVRNVRSAQEPALRHNLIVNMQRQNSPVASQVQQLKLQLSYDLSKNSQEQQFIIRPSIPPVNQKPVLSASIKTPIATNSLSSSLVKSNLILGSTSQLMHSHQASVSVINDATNVISGITYACPGSIAAMQIGNNLRRPASRQPTLSTPSSLMTLRPCASSLLGIRCASSPINRSKIIVRKSDSATVLPKTSSSATTQIINTEGSKIIGGCKSVAATMLPTATFTGVTTYSGNAAVAVVTSNNGNLISSVSSTKIRMSGVNASVSTLSSEMLNQPIAASLVKHNTISAVSPDIMATTKSYKPVCNKPTVCKIFDRGSSNLEKENSSVSCEQTPVQVQGKMTVNMLNKRSKLRIRAVYRFYVPGAKRKLEVIWDGLEFTPKKPCLETSAFAVTTTTTCSTESKASLQAHDDAIPCAAENSVNNTELFVCTQCRIQCIGAACERCGNSTVYVQPINCSSNSSSRGGREITSSNMVSISQMSFSVDTGTTAAYTATPEVVQISDDEEETADNATESYAENPVRSVTTAQTTSAQPSSGRASVTPVATVTPFTRTAGGIICSTATSASSVVQGRSAIPLTVRPALFIQPLRQLYIGSLPVLTASSCSYSLDGIAMRFTARLPHCGSDFLLLKLTDIRVMLVHFGPCGPVLFLLLSPHGAASARSKFGIPAIAPPPGSFMHYYDPYGRVESQRLITCIPQQPAIPLVENDVRTALSAMVVASAVRSSDTTQHQELQLKYITSETTSQILSLVMSESAHRAQQSPAARQLQQLHSGAMCDASAGAAQIEDEEEAEEGERAVDRSRSPSPPPQVAFTGPVVKLFTYPPPPAPGGMQITNEDYFCLMKDEFLNDVIIDFYLRYLLLETLGPEDRARTHVFSSFFYRRLTQRDAAANSQENSHMTLEQQRHARVCKWTRRVDIFSKDFIIVPINESAHWYLAIICFPGLTEPVYAEENNAASNDVASSEKLEERRIVKQPCILIFDSLAMPSRYGVVRTLRDYIQCEWNARKEAVEGKRSITKDNMKGACPRCPLQNNLSDCGIYVLQYIESFYLDPINDYRLPIKSTVTWFSEERISHKRDELKQLIISLQHSLNPQLDYDPEAHCQAILSGSSSDLPSHRMGDSTISEAEHDGADVVLADLEQSITPEAEVGNDDVLADLHQINQAMSNEAEPLNEVEHSEDDVLANFDRPTTSVTEPNNEDDVLADHVAQATHEADFNSDDDVLALADLHQSTSTAEPNEDDVLAVLDQATTSEAEHNNEDGVLTDFCRVNVNENGEIVPCVEEMSLTEPLDGETGIKFSRTIDNCCGDGIAKVNNKGTIVPCMIGMIMPVEEESAVLLHSGDNNNETVVVKSCGDKTENSAVIFDSEDILDALGIAETSCEADFSSNAKYNVSTGIASNSICNTEPIIEDLKNLSSESSETFESNNDSSIATVADNVIESLSEAIVDVNLGSQQISTEVENRLLANILPVVNENGSSSIEDCDVNCSEIKS